MITNITTNIFDKDSNSSQLAKSSSFDKKLLKNQNNDSFNFVNNKQTNINFGSKLLLQSFIKSFKKESKPETLILNKTVTKIQEQLIPLKRNFVTTGSLPSKPAPSEIAAEAKKIAESKTLTASQKDALINDLNNRYHTSYHPVVTKGHINMPDHTNITPDDVHPLVDSADVHSLSNITDLTDHHNIIDGIIDSSDISDHASHFFGKLGEWFSSLW